MNPCFAIIDRNTLSSSALRSILHDIYDQVEIHTYGTIEEFIQDSNRHFVHFFVSADILFGQAEEFEMLKEQTTVLACGRYDAIEKAGYMILDCTIPEQELTTRLLELHGSLHRMKAENECSKAAALLSAREKEVLQLIVKGKINKEIAEILNISTPTVIFHRNNICDKLNTRSIGKLTVYAVLSGLVELNGI